MEGMHHDLNFNRFILFQRFPSSYMLFSSFTSLVVFLCNLTSSPREEEEEEGKEEEEAAENINRIFFPLMSPLFPWSVITDHIPKTFFFLQNPFRVLLQFLVSSVDSLLLLFREWNPLTLTINVLSSCTSSYFSLFSYSSWDREPGLTLENQRRKVWRDRVRDRIPWL